MITLDESNDLFTESLKLIEDKEFFIDNVISNIDLNYLELKPYFLSFNIDSKEFVLYLEKSSDFGKRLGNIVISNTKFQKRIKFYNNPNDAIYDWLLKAYRSQQAILSEAYLGNTRILISLIEKNKFPKIILTSDY